MFNENLQDLEIQCAECGQTFVFSGEDQEYHRQKGYSAPKRCMACRSKRRTEQRGGGGGAHRQRQMYQVTCDACGCQTEVPFKPNGEKPVYCKDCYQKA